MDKSIRLITLLVVSIALALNAWGQVGVNPLPDRLPIGDWDSIRLWTLTNNLWQTTVSVQISYQDSVNTNTWSGNQPWGYVEHFTSYDEYEAYLQERGMYWVNYFKNGMASPGSLVHLASIIAVDWEEKSYGPLILNADLGPIENVTSNSFLGLYQKFPGVVVPIKGLERFEMRYGDLDYNSPYYFWYKWDHGTNSLSWGGKNDYCAKTNTIVLNSTHIFATNRIRFTAVANGWTNIYTQHGDRLRPAIVTRNGDMLNINTPKGSDIVIQRSTNLLNWTTVLTRKWSENTNDVSFKIDAQSPQGFYRVSVR